MPSASSSSSPLGDDPIIIEVSDTDDDGGGGVALSTKVAERIASSLTQEELDAICSKYGVPEQYSAVLPAGHQRACSPLPPGAICVNEHALEAGMRVPLHAFFCEVLAHFGVAPIQIAPNGWRAMAGFIVLSHKAGVAPSLPVFRHFFSLCGFRFKGWYYFRGKDVAGALFKGMPPSFAGWKEAFFFLKSPTPWPCRVKWGHELSKGSTVEPVLTKGEERVAKKLLDVHGEAVDIKTYLSESNLAAAMITGMDPSATQAQGQASGVTVKPEPGSDTSSLGKKMKVTDDAAKPGPSRPQPSTPLDHDHGLFPGVPPSPPGMSTQKDASFNRFSSKAAVAATAVDSY
ncbi:hypothetical protein SORBI_3010G058600 [Sorghum bicolor]|uniref:Transposase (putative) gypsy type domain-containing protein n=1 Tax=Sorghum bicolor TaxID=4558 RepID=A0A194YIK7_SORBI|nr:hypothetical protein SORBI_3010G058600 [Sorghum bicolor]